MEVIIQEDDRAASLLAARIVAALLRAKPSAVLGLATGRTPTRLYEELVRLHREEGLSFRSAIAYNLDEYVGLPPEHEGSYHAFMCRHLFDRIDIQPENVHLPDGNAPDIPAECLRYEERIRTSGGIDLQILGLGTDGHIGFNEPTSSLGSRTRIKTLRRQTRIDNAAAFGGADRVPAHVITMGIGSILEARTCLLLAFGEPKADAVGKAVEGPVTAMLPASALQFHRDARIILDRPAAARLTLREYYDEVYRGKPAWQKY